MNKNQQGFSLIEVFVTLTIGLVLFAGVLSVFVGMRTTTQETTQYGELQENGRLAISILSDDLLRQDFWGDYTGTFDLASINPVPAAPVGDCIGGGVNNGTFPLANGHFRTLWGQTVVGTNVLGCRNDAVAGSDLIQIKRVQAMPLVDGAGDPIAVAPAGNFYLATNISEGTVFAAGAVPAIDNSQVWQYQHHVYYVRNENQGANIVPVLMFGQLTGQMTFTPIIDGIEMIRFMYGVDTTDDGIVNAYIPATAMSENYWDNANDSNIIAVKIYVLARNVLPDMKYNNTNTYTLGDIDVAVNDNFRRLVFSSTVTLYNARVDAW